jgi:hypothetical protein
VVDAAMAEVAAAAPRGGERLGGAMLSLTGGEPMLRKDLTSLVRRGREAGAWAVQLQTNATLVTAEQAALLAAAGLTHALVGLHAADAATYGEITTTPQLFERALAGVAALLSVGVEVTVNCVLTTATAQQAVGLVVLLADGRSCRSLQPPISPVGRWTQRACHGCPSWQDRCARPSNAVSSGTNRLRAWPIRAGCRRASSAPTCASTPICCAGSLPRRRCTTARRPARAACWPPTVQACGPRTCNAMATVNWLR